MSVKYKEIVVDTIWQIPKKGCYKSVFSESRLDSIYSNEIHYTIDGIYTREDGPAIIRYHNLKKTMEYFWMKDGYYHSLKGPASIASNSSLYFINGKKMSKEEWEIERIKYINEQEKNKIKDQII